MKYTKFAYGSEQMIRNDMREREREREKERKKERKRERERERKKERYMMKAVESPTLAACT
jgi:hypothetical protein